MGRFGYFAVAGACALSLALAGCGGSVGTSNSTEASQGASSAASSSSAAAAVSEADWEFSALDEINLTNSAQKLYEKAADDEDAADYTPVAVLAEQVVSGTNYAYLCESDDDEWHVVVVYETLKNKASIISDETIDIADVKVLNLDAGGAGEEATGAWEPEMPDAPATITEASHSAFDAATSDTDNVQGLELIPIATLGTQAADPGVNYRYLCGGQPADNASSSSDDSSSSSESGGSLYVVDVYAASEDNADVTGLKFFDLLSYIGN